MYPWDADGTNDYASKASDLTGSADHSQGLLSCWVRLDGGDSNNQNIFGNTTGTPGIALKRLSSNLMRIQLANAAGTSTLLIASTGTYLASATWLHVLSSWDCNFSAGNKLRHLYINDVNVLDTGSGDTAAAFNVDYTRTEWAFGAISSGSQKVNGCMGEIWFNMGAGSYLDLSNVDNRRKFIDSNGDPVDLLPLGQPICYFKSLPGSAGTNSGSGGDFTVTGSFDAASTSPSD